MNNRDLEKLKFDTRMIEINKKARSITQEELEKQLSKLPDLSSNCESIDLDRIDDDSSNH